MNDLALPAESAEDTVLSEAETLVRLTVRENGDRVSMIRALEEMLSALPVPPFADRRIALFREVGVLCYPGEVHLLEKLAKLTYPPGSALRAARSELTHLNCWGVVKKMKGERVQAMRMFLRCASRAAELNIAFPTALINLNTIAWGAGLHHAAVSYLQQAKAQAKGYPRVAAVQNLAYCYFFLHRFDEALKEAQFGLCQIPGFLDAESTGEWQYVAQDLYLTSAAAHALHGDVDAAEACLERAGEWARRGDAAALRASRLHELAVRAIARRDASDIPELRKLVADPLSRNILGEAGDHLLYLACRAVADVDGATDALEQMSRSVRERLSEVVDEFAELPEQTLAPTSPQRQFDAYIGARAAELRLPDLQGSSDHLLDLAISAAAVEDQSGLHPYRTACLTRLLAQEVGSSDREVDVAERAAMLHEIGKAAVPVSVLETGGANDRERTLYDGYANFGAEWIERGRFPDSAEVARIVRLHAAPYDGQTGLLAGEALPLGARLVRIADAFDTLVCGRRAQLPLSVQDALREMLRQRGRDFDPRLTDHFIALVRRLELEHGDLLAFLEDGAEIPEARHRLGKFT